MERQEIIYMIPANSKRSMLIFGFFRPVDLGIFLTGLVLSLILLVVISGNTAGALILKLLPACFATFLIIPIPNYHNVRVLIMEIYEFLINRRIFIWKGWCFSSEYTEKKQR